MTTTGVGARRRAPAELKPGGVESESHPWKIRLVDHHVSEESEAAAAFLEAQEQGKMAVLPPNSSVALQAFARQIEPGRRTASGPPAASSRPARAPRNRERAAP
jgi:hypothetical protein